MNVGDPEPLRVVGRYALYNQIAAGGMATVHIGRLLGPVGFARTVAIKRLHPQFAKDPEFVSMFLDEARLAARVQHPNVVATIDVVATDGELFLIMDYVRGESLARLIRAARSLGERVPPRIASAIVCGFLHGLHAAHEARNERGEHIHLVHRDVSPANVLVGADGVPRVLDFGIAKAAGRIQVTRDGQIKGKLAYMPREQLTGRELTRAVDIYASAVVMWETLTGERLFKAETEADTLSKILLEPVLPPSAVVPGLPTAFDAPLLKALSREPNQRHATARELAFELEKCVGVASSSEVGDWVERMVGAILAAREDQIAEIESNSAGIRVSPSGRPESEVHTSSDVHAVGTRFHNALGPGLTSRGMAEGTGSSGTGSGLTSSLWIALDRPLVLFASAVGFIALLVLMAVVLRARASAQPAADSAADSATTIAPDNGATPSAPSAGGTTRASATQAASAPSDTPAASEVGSASTAPAPTAAHPTARPASTATSARTAGTAATPTTATVRKNCDPPYTVDANGRRKYKLECM